jgi:hypothetical protein
MRVVSVPSANTPTLVVTAREWTQFCDIYNDSDTSMRICYDGSDGTGLVATPAGSEVGVELKPAGVLSLASIFASQQSKNVYAVHAAASPKRVQVQEY